MLTASYGPMSIAFWLVFLFDSQQSRDKMIYSLSTTKLGPFGLLWVGLYTFMMNANDTAAMGLVAGTTDTYLPLTDGSRMIGQGANVFFIILYLLMNVGAIFLHVAWGPKVYVWAKKAPLPKDAPASDPAH